MPKYDPEVLIERRAEESNMIEKMAEAILYAWMHTDTGATMPDRTAADHALDSQEWADFWQNLSIERRKVYRAQAKAALRASQLLERVEELEDTIDEIHASLLKWRPTPEGNKRARAEAREIIAKLD